MASISRVRCQVFGCALVLFFAAFSCAAIGGQSAADTVYPAPGTYKLERIKEAASGWVIEDSVWKPRRLSSYTEGAITLLSFFYGTCRDPQGCPAAWSAFETVHQEIEKDEQLRGRVRLVFVSLDPVVDTPEMLSFYRNKSTPASPWYFLTTWSQRFLKPILEGMGITIGYEIDENGNKTGQILHMLKIFLIDEDSWVREIYSSNFLDPEVALNDIRTLLLEAERAKGNG